MCELDGRQMISSAQTLTHRAVHGTLDAAVACKLAIEDLALQGGASAAVQRGVWSSPCRPRTNRSVEGFAAHLERKAEVRALVGDGVDLTCELLDEHLLRSQRTAGRLSELANCVVRRASSGALKYKERL